MDLLSLPQEMLASVLKYVPFNSLLKLRKTSSTVDVTAKKYELQKIDINLFQITTNGSDLIVLLKLNPDIEHDLQEDFRKSHQHESLASVVEFYFSKIRRLNAVAFCASSAITDDTAEIILKNRSLKIAKFYFVKCEFNFDIRWLRNILINHPVRDLTFNLLGKNRNEHLLYKNEMYEGLQLHSLTLKGGGPDATSELDITFLRQLCSKKLPRWLIVDLHVNVNEFGVFLEQHFGDSLTEHVNWILTVQAGNMNADQISEYFKNLKCFSKYKTSLYVRENVVEVFIIKERTRLQINVRLA